MHLNFFVLSAAVALYLVIRYAHLQFSDVPKDLFMGLEILKPYAILNRLCEKVGALENAMTRLGYSLIGVGRQRHFNESPRHESPYLHIVETDWCDEIEAKSELVNLKPTRFGSFSSFLTQPDPADLFHDIGWLSANIPTNSSRD